MYIDIRDEFSMSFFGRSIRTSMIPPDISEVRSKKWFRLSKEEAIKRNLSPNDWETILVDKQGNYLFNSHLYFKDEEIEQMEEIK